MSEVISDSLEWTFPLLERYAARFGNLSFICSR